MLVSSGNFKYYKLKQPFPRLEKNKSFLQVHHFIKQFTIKRNINTNQKQKNVCFQENKHTFQVMYYPQTTYYLNKTTRTAALG